MNGPKITPQQLEKDDNCARLVATKILEYYEIPDTESVISMLNGFGEGFGEGSICGAISGSLVAVNRVLSDHGLNEEETKEYIKEIKSQFKEKYGSVNCKAILSEYVQLEDISNTDDPKRLKSCSQLLSDSAEEVEEVIGFALSVTNPIMQRFDRI